MIKKPSFLERLTGAHEPEFEDDGFEMDEYVEGDEEIQEQDQWDAAREEEVDGELPIDMYETDEEIVIRAMVSGVSPTDLDISITRDMVTLRGQREESQEVSDDGYFHRELFWGSFSRTILLPEEVLIDEAEAREKHGLLEIVLPKVDKNRSARLKVSSK